MGMAEAGHRCGRLCQIVCDLSDVQAVPRKLPGGAHAYPNEGTMANGRSGFPVRLPGSPQDQAHGLLGCHRQVHQMGHSDAVPSQPHFRGDSGPPHKGHLPNIWSARGYYCGSGNAIHLKNLGKDHEILPDRQPTGDSSARADKWPGRACQ